MSQNYERIRLKIIFLKIRGFQGIKWCISCFLSMKVQLICLYGLGSFQMTPKARHLGLQTLQIGVYLQAISFIKLSPL